MGPKTASVSEMAVVGPRRKSRTGSDRHVEAAEHSNEHKCHGNANGIVSNIPPLEGVAMRVHNKL
jgi:hypothetical protein